MALGYVEVEPETVQLQPPHPQAPAAQREAHPHDAPQQQQQQQGGPPTHHSDHHAPAAAPLGGGLGNGLYAGQEDHVRRSAHLSQSLLMTAWTPLWACLLQPHSAPWCYQHMVAA